MKTFCIFVVKYDKYYMKKDDIKTLTEELAVDVKRKVNKQILNESAKKSVYKKIMEYKMPSLKNTLKKPEVSEEEIDREEFELYRLNWISNTVLSSNPNIIFEDENYKNIINMGKRAVPFIYEILKQRASYTVHALQHIYGYSLRGGKYTPLDTLCNLWVKEIEKNEYGK